MKTMLNKLFLISTVVLVTSLSACAQKQDKKFLWLSVREKNDRARKFYEASGMRHITDTEFRTESQISKLHIMGMEI